MRTYGIYILILFFFGSLSAQFDSLYVTVSGDTATIWHTLTYRNCGSLFVMDVQLEDTLITVTEVDTGAPAFCNCYFDLSVTIGPLDPGFYTVQVFSTDSSYGYEWGSTSFTIGGINLVDHETSDCLDTRIGTRNDSSSIEMNVIDGMMTLSWFDIILNCCLDPWWNGWLDGDTFYVTMSDTGEPCDCICPFNLSATFGPFTPGTYTLNFWDGYYGYPTFIIQGGRASPIVISEYQSDCYFPLYNGPVWHVSTSGSDESGNGSLESPFASIQHGVDVAGEGDTILVDPGTYVDNINFNGKNIVVGSLFIITEDTSYISKTVIDGNQINAVVLIESGEDSTTLLSGFTITNGSAGDGGGIAIGNNSSPYLSHLIVIGNTARDGGGIDCWNYSRPTLENIRVSENIASDGYGGGIQVDNSTPTFIKVTVNGNMASYGGGIAILGDSNPKFVNVTISDNNASMGGGIVFDGAIATVLNSILWDNWPQEIFYTDWSLSSIATIAYSNVKGGQEEIVTNNNGTINWLNGNVRNDPLFIDPENDDFNLQEGSPCIDTGTPFYIWQGDTLINLPVYAYEGNAPDIGAYESPYTVGIIVGDFFPTEFALFQPYPNPFNPATTIEFSIPLSGIVTLTVYDVLGRRVETILNEFRDIGYHKVQWSASDVPSGIYFIQMNADGFHQVKKVLVVR